MHRFCKKYFFNLTLFSLLLQTDIFSQEVAFSASDSLRSYHIVTLKDGTVLKGKIVVQDKKAIQFQDEMIGTITFRTKDVSSMEKVDPQEYYLVTMMNGTTLQGKIVNRTEKDIVMETANIGRIDVDITKIKTIKSITPGNMQDGRYWFTTHVDAHYVIIPSAIALRPGEAYLQNTMGLFNSFDVGITSHFSCMGGIVIPMAAFIAPNINYKIRKGIHIGGGVLFADITGAPYAGAAYGQLTFGNRNSHLSVGGAYGVLEGIKKYYYVNKIEKIELGLISISALKRFSPKYAIVTENWFTPTEGIRV
ncbi:MAG: hypothetical protein EPN85_13780, partial [Bacteroidetes bacterium]